MAKAPVNRDAPPPAPADVDEAPKVESAPKPAPEAKAEDIFDPEKPWCSCWFKGWKHKEQNGKVYDKVSGKLLFAPKGT